jgi:hypothetical protein
VCRNGRCNIDPSAQVTGAANATQKLKRLRQIRLRIPTRSRKKYQDHTDEAKYEGSHLHPRNASAVKMIENRGPHRNSRRGYRYESCRQSWGMVFPTQNRQRQDVGKLLMASGTSL